ncbi:MAG: hypothetical protein ACOYVF_06450 [Candidatus Zixiibacteriota bacterium]
MDCFFGSYELPADNDTGKSTVVTFFIPDIGIRFKAPFDAVNTDHSDFASLLALLEFIDSNQKYFSNHTYQIFGNNQHVINLVNEREIAPIMFSPLMEKAQNYRIKYRFSLEWVPTWDNSAYDSLLD